MAGTDWEDELARLRERAYGPDADLIQDADARARLQELELRQSEASRSINTSVGESTHAGAVDPAADASASAPGTERAAPTRARLRPRIVVWWIVSVVAAAALGAAGATTVLRASGAHEAVLHVVDAPTVGSAFDPTDVQSIRNYGTFVGIHVASGVVTGRPCLTVWTTATAPAAALDCGTQQFPPSVDLALDNARDEAIPAQAVERFGRGAILRFSLTGSVVTVDVVK
jgi:hypothetical protein